VAYSQAWIDECQNRFGEAMSVRLRMRLIDGHNHIKGNQASDFSSWNQGNGATQIGSTVTFNGGLSESWQADRGGITLIHDSGGGFNPCLYKTVSVDLKADAVASVFFKMGNCYGYDNFISILDIGAGGTHHYLKCRFNASGVLEESGSYEIDGYGIEDVGEGWYRAWCYVDTNTRGITDNGCQARVYHNHGSTTDGDSVLVFCPQVEYGKTEPSVDCLTTTDEANTYAVLGTYKELTEVEEVLAVNPVKRERERNFGVLQARDWQVKLSNSTQYFTRRKLIGGWLELQAGFETADLWESVGVGQIQSATLSSDATISINVTDRIRALLDAKTPRDAYYKYGEAWASNLTTVSVDDDSEDYNNDWNDDDIDEGVQIDKPSYAYTETIKIVFTSDTAFKAVFEDETEQTGFAITADALIDSPNSLGSDVYRLKMDGWSTESNAYASGDTFEFSATAILDSFIYNPVGMSFYLIVTLSQLKWVNVYEGVLESVLDSSDLTDWVSEANNWSLDRIGGYWAKGSSVVDMIQGCLKLCHGSIVCRPDGRLRLYILGESEPSITIESKAGQANSINLLSSVFKDDLKYTAERVTFRYKTLQGDDATYTAETSTPDFATAQVEKEFDVKWEVKDNTVETAVNRYLNRFGEARRTYELKTTLAGATLDLSDAIHLHETMIDDGNYITAEVSSVILAPLSNTAKITAYVDHVAMSTFARVADMYGVGTLVDDGSGTYSTDPIF